MRRPLLLLLVMLSLLSAAAPAGATEPAPLVEKAAGRPALASSTERSGLEAGQAVDGAGGTRWGSAFADGQWWQVDLGSARLVDRVEVTWEAAYAARYRISISEDGVTFAPVAEASATGAGARETTFAVRKARYVRITGVTRGTQWGISFWEARVLGPADPVPLEKAQGRPATASSTEGAGYAPSQALDGDTGTRWSSAFADSQWWQVDLGSARLVDRLRVDWEVAYAARYRISTSQDGTSFTTAAEPAVGRPGVHETTFAARRARYVRITGLNRATGWGISFWEAAVFGPEDPPEPAPAPSPVPEPAPKPAPTPAPAADPAWADEFTGAAGAPPAAANWSVVPWCDNWGSLSCNTARTENVGLDGAGHLKLVARKEDWTDAWGNRGSYTAARVDTKGKFAFQYGTLSARIKIPAGRGLWPAFWTLGSGGQWPRDGEIDVLESLGHEPDVAYASVHAPTTSGEHWSITRPHRAADSLAGDFHVYTVRWTPDTLVYEIDGRQTASITRAQLAPDQVWVFDRPQYLLLDLAVGGPWPGAPDASTAFPAAMLVDWVRVYR